MALGNDEESILIYVSIKNGELVIKNKDKSVSKYKTIKGTIYDVKYKMDFYENVEFELAQIFIKDGDERYCLQMKTDSGYFRGFCNSLKSGDITKPVILKPHIEKDGSRNKTTIFVKQEIDGKLVSLKHLHTVNNMGDCPSVKEVYFGNKKHWDGSEQLQFFKNWLISHGWESHKEDDKEEDDIPSNHSYSDISDDDLPF
jgi:hypothetical protein